MTESLSHLKDPRVTHDASAICEKSSAATPVAEVQEQHHHHFSTAHLLGNLKGRTISSGLITLVSQGTLFLLTLGSTAVLARLLTPKDFGLVAMAATVIGFARVFKDAGLSTATVQREGITHAQVSNLFWINGAVSGVTTLLVVGAAPLIAWFYREPRLVLVSAILATTFLLGGLGVQHTALLNRQMRFKAIAFIEICSMSVSVGLGIGMARLGYGFWSLVWANVSLAGCRLLLVWSFCRWRPQLPRRGVGTGTFVKFGANLAAGAFLYSLARGTDNLLIGRCYGSNAVGLYSRAGVLLMRPLEQFLVPLNSVFLPVLSRLQHQPERYRRTFLRIYDCVALATFPVSALFLALAHPLVLVVLGRKWESAAPIFSGFTLVALYFPLGNVSTWLYDSQGRGSASLRSSILVSIVTVIAFVAGLPYGPTGVAIVYSCSCLLIQLPILYYIAGGHGPVSTRDLWLGFAKHLPLWAVVWGTTLLARNFISGLGPMKELLICGPVGLLAGAVFLFLYPPGRRSLQGSLDALRVLTSRGRAGGD